MKKIFTTVAALVLMGSVSFAQDAPKKETKKAPAKKETKATDSKMADKKSEPAAADKKTGTKKPAPAAKASDKKMDNKK